MDTTIIGKTFSPPQAAKLLGVSPDQVRGWINSKALEAVNLGKGSRPHWQITREALERFIESRTSQAIS